MSDRERLIEYCSEKLPDYFTQLAVEFETGLSGLPMDYLLVRDACHYLFYHESLKSPKNECLGELLNYMSRFANPKMPPPDSVELLFLIFRLKNYDLSRGRFADKADSPNTPFSGMYL